MAIKTFTELNTDYGKFKISYHTLKKDMCISFVMGDITEGIVKIRIHSSCLFGEAFRAKDCDCRQQLHKAMEIIEKDGKGIIIYLYQEGRGMGLDKKIQSINMEHIKNMDTVEAYEMLGFPLDSRDYSVAIEALKDLNASRDLILMCNNPRKSDFLTKNGYNIIEHLELNYKVSKEAEKYLKCKKAKLDHLINFDRIDVEG